MGSVVEFQTSSKRGSRRKRGSRTALVLGGGGFTGGVYQVGALRALDLLSVNKTVNDFDIYVGTSAGSFVASLAANGVTPEEMMRVVTGQVPAPFPDVEAGSMLRLKPLQAGQKAAVGPFRPVPLAPHPARQAGRPGQITPLDPNPRPARRPPPGLYP